MTTVSTYFKPERKPKRERAWNSTLPRASKRLESKGRSFKASGVSLQPGQLKPGARTLSSGVTPEMRAEVFRRARGVCQADGLHDPRCPGVLEPGWGWNCHHIQPRSKGGADEVDNLLAIWTGGPAAAGCHARIHGRPAEAKALGLLRGRATATL